MDMGEAAFKAFSGGRSLDAEGKRIAGMSVPELAAAAVAEHGTQKAAAASLGITPRTLRRWASGSVAKPSGLDEMRRLARAAGRRARLGKVKEAKLRGKPDWSVSGRVRVRSGKDPAGDDRHRTVHPGRNLPEGSLSAALDAYLAGDDAAAGAALEAQLSRYVAGMSMAEGEVESLTLG